MATRPVVENFLELTGELYNKPRTEKSVDAWMEALRRFRDHEIAPAMNRAIDECQKMPTPMDIIQRIPVSQMMENEHYRMTQAKCSKCDRYSLAISEPPGDPWLCRECYTGLTNQEIAERFKKLGEKVTHAKL